MSEISDANAKLDQLEAALAVNHTLLDELKALVDANPGGTIAAADVTALTDRMDADLQKLQEVDASDTPTPVVPPAPPTPPSI